MDNIKEIIAAFPDYGEVIGYKPITSGHINDTYIVEYKLDNGETVRYLLQRINTVVFKMPVELMEWALLHTFVKRLRKKVAILQEKP